MYEFEVGKFYCINPRYKYFGVSALNRKILEEVGYNTFKVLELDNDGDITKIKTSSGKTLDAQKDFKNCCIFTTTEFGKNALLEVEGIKLESVYGNVTNYEVYDSSEKFVVGIFVEYEDAERAAMEHNGIAHIEEVIIKRKVVARSQKVITKID